MIRIRLPRWSSMGHENGILLGLEGKRMVVAIDLRFVENISHS